MANTELEMIKEIPGYKMILKAVLKGQIHQLVQQLALHTDEESIILTASVADGTLSHLGSDNGKSFLENHEDIKSQFLGFCLKSRHKQQLQKDDTACVQTPSSRPVLPRLSPKVASPKQRGGESTRSSPRVRHEPYPLKRAPTSRRSLDTDIVTNQTETIPDVSKSGIPSVVFEESVTVKIEHPESIQEFTRELLEAQTVHQSISKEKTFESQSTSQNEATFQSEAEKKMLDSESRSAPVIENINKAIPEGLFVNSNFASSVSLDKSDSESKTDVDIHTESNVKVEAISESDMELEITGVEPGEKKVLVNPYHSTEAAFSPPSDATGNQGDTAVHMSQRISSKNPDYLPSPQKAKSKDDEQIITSGNAGVFQAETRTKKRKRGNYNAYDSEQRAKMAHHAVEYGVMNASRKYSVSESTIRNLKKQFLQMQSKEGTAPAQLEKKDRGKPLLLGSSLDTDIQTYVKYQRQAGNPISVQLLLGAAHGIILSKNRQLLTENGGPLGLTKTWAQSLLRRMGFVNRKGTKAEWKVPSDFNMQKMQFLAGVKRKVSKYSIPDDLIINFDQTGVNIVPVGNYTLEVCGSKQVPSIGMEDKRQITAVLGCTLSGKLLPPQIIYQGKTDQCHPKFDFPDGWDITHSENHLSNSVTMKQYVDNILLPYIKSVRDTLPPSQSDQAALCIFDVFDAHRTEEFNEALSDANINVRYVPASCTGDLQPLEISGNIEFKHSLKSKFQKWYSCEIDKKLKAGGSIDTIHVDLRLSTLKPIHAGWMVSAIEGMKADSIKLGWEKSGISTTLK